MAFGEEHPVFMREGQGARQQIEKPDCIICDSFHHRRILSLNVIPDLCYQAIKSRTSKVGFGFEKDKTRIRRLFTGVTKIVLGRTK